MPTKAGKKLLHLTMNFGADPEFFFAKKTLKGRVGKIIGAEKIIPKEGIKTEVPNSANTSRLTIDGVQAEANPHFYTCRQSFAYDMGKIFANVAKITKGKRIVVDWRPTVRITPTELRSLSPECRLFGCSPSLNAYGEHIEQPDPSVYMYRSAGGHIHIGKVWPSGADPVRDALKGDLKEIVKVLDIIVGNTCVMIDRDPGNIERRKAYGRAGEYRKQPHGLEYRVLSNFWLKNYSLASMVLGLIRLGMGFATDKEATKRLMGLVNEKDIRAAINNNDFDLAKANFEKIKPLIIEMAGMHHSLNARRIPLFEHFVCKGLNRWFRGDPIKHWTSGRIGGNGIGWERFLDERVAKDLYGAEISR